MHKNRTVNGLRLQQKHEDRYTGWLLGKKNTEGKVITDVEWVGNSVYGIVKVIFDNKEEVLVGGDGFRPTKDDCRRRLKIEL